MPRLFYSQLDHIKQFFGSYLEYKHHRGCSPKTFLFAHTSTLLSARYSLTLCGLLKHVVIMTSWCQTDNVSSLKNCLMTWFRFLKNISVHLIQNVKFAYHFPDVTASQALVHSSCRHPPPDYSSRQTSVSCSFSNMWQQRTIIHATEL